MKLHNIIYQTTNLINGKIYTGRHPTNNLNDGYLGSGKEFQRDLKLLGKDSFERMTEYWAEMGGHTDEAKEKMRQANLGRVNVKDKDGNKFKVSVNDPRYSSGELICAFLGTKLSDTARKKISENKKENLWISNVEMRKIKLVKPEEVERYLAEGWIKYRMMFNKPNKRKNKKFEEIMLGSK